MQIVPAILVTNLRELKSQFGKVSLLSRRLSFDLADGMATTNKTIALEEMLLFLKKQPNIENWQIDFDLMLVSWEEAVKTIKKNPWLKSNLFLVHQKFLKTKQDYRKQNIGLAIDEDDELDFDLVSLFPAAQIMTVKIGFQGGKFLPENIQKIKQLRENNYQGEILVDGGINEQTLALFIQKNILPDVLVVGSYFTQAANPNFNWQTLNRIIKQQK